MRTLQLLLVALSSLSFVSRGSAKFFGTNNGYDQEGGTDPICWTRTPKSAVAVDDYSIDFVRDMQDNLKGTPAELLDECFEGLTMVVRLVKTDSGTDKEKTLVAGSRATFEMNMTLDTSSLGGLVLAPANQLVWRIKFCDAGRTGFCTPFKRHTASETEDDDSTLPVSVGNETDRDSTLPSLGANISVGSDEPESAMWFSGPLELNNFSTTENATYEDGSTKLVLLSTTTFVIPKDVPGTYYGIGHAVLLVGPDENTSSYQLDVANALPRRVFTVVPPPVLMKPTRAYKIGISVLLGIVALFQLTLLAHIVVYRTNMVLKVSQPRFLSWLVFCCLTASVSCILFIPENDVYCNLWSPLIMIPVSTIASILVARMWRMYVILSSSLRLSLIAPKKRVYEERFMSALTFLASWHESAHDRLTNILRVTPPPSRQRRRPSLFVAQHQLRKEVTDRHVLQLIVTLTIPQVLVQIIALSLYPAWIDVAESDGISRVVCASSNWWPRVMSLLIVIFLFLMAVLVAWICRDLPSLFNEKKQVFRASCINFVVMVFAAAMVLLTDFETSSPNIRAFLWTAVTFCTTLTPCIYVVLPKVLRARQGETVVMSRLFSQESSNLHRNSSLNIPPVRMDDRSSGNMVERSTEKKVVIREFEPPPRQLEYQLLAMKDLLTKINDSSTEGRRITKQEWLLLQNSSDALNAHLQLLQFDFDETDEEQDAHRQDYARSVAEVFSLTE